MLELDTSGSSREVSLDLYLLVVESLGLCCHVVGYRLTVGQTPTETLAGQDR